MHGFFNHDPFLTHELDNLIIIEIYLIYQLSNTHMKTPETTIGFFLNLAKTQTILARRFDSHLGGLGFQ